MKDEYAVLGNEREPSKIVKQIPQPNRDSRLKKESSFQKLSSIE